MILNLQNFHFWVLLQVSCPFSFLSFHFLFFSEGAKCEARINILDQNQTANLIVAKSTPYHNCKTNSENSLKTFRFDFMFIFIF